MATHRRRTILFLLNLLFLLSTAAAISAVDDAVSGTPPQEMEAMCRVLRSNGYNLFCNAIATSDLEVQLAFTANASINTAAESSSSVIVTAGANFTLFSPKDKFLYTLDMASDAADYVAALHYHIVPGRVLALSDLKNLSSPFMDTLLPHYSILIYRTDNASVTIDGVTISDPDLYLGSRIAVHGLDGILLSGYSQPYEDCEADHGLGFISSLDDLNSHQMCLNLPAPTPKVLPPVPTPTIISPVPTPTVLPPAPTNTVLPPAPTPRASPSTLKPKVSPPSPKPKVLPPSPKPKVSPPSPTPKVSPPSPTPKVSPPSPKPKVSPPSPTPKVSPPSPTPRVSPPSPKPKVSPPAPTPKVSPPSPTTKVPLQLLTGNRGKDYRHVRRGKSHRQGTRSVPRRNNHTKGGGDDL